VIPADIDPLWKKIWKTEGIRWLGPKGNGMADAMERFQHGFELGAASEALVSKEWEGLARTLYDRILHADELIRSEYKCSQEWRQLAGDLSESASALWCVLRAGERPSPFVVSVFLEAARKYERMVEVSEVNASESSEDKGDEK
jgi:hypothetical protein